MNVTEGSLQHKFRTLINIRRRLELLQQDANVIEYLRLLKMKEDMMKLFENRADNKFR